LDALLEKITRTVGDALQGIAFIEGISFGEEERSAYLTATNSTFEAYAVQIAPSSDYTICVYRRSGSGAMIVVTREKDSIGNVLLVAKINDRTRVVLPLNANELRVNEHLTTTFASQFPNNVLICFMDTRAKDRKKLLKRWQHEGGGGSGGSGNSSLFINDGFPSDKFVDKFFVVASSPVSVKIGQNVFDVSPYHHENIIRVCFDNLLPHGAYKMQSRYRLVA
jgi:hypothetical protein